MGGDKVTFSFGKNWEAFVERNFSDERVAISRDHMLGFLGRKELSGKTFLDVGCGSGIHSLAAFRSGAARVTSFDIDPYSVRTTRRMHELAGGPANWEVLHGSVLDAAFVSALPTADIVYSWGVLHHTGALWEALRNAATRVAPGGVFYLALYEKTEMSDHWIRVKKRYNASGPLAKRFMEIDHVWRHFFRSRSLKNILESIRYIRTYRQYRGMEFWTDIRDWLGGWPYEPSTPEEVTAFATGELGLRVLKVKTGEANVEYLLGRDG